MDYTSKYPSSEDINGYNEVNQLPYHPTRKDYRQNTPKHTIYHPISPNKKSMPYNIEYNSGGPIKYINGKAVNMSKQEIEKNENLYKSTYVNKPK